MKYCRLSNFSAT